MTTYTEKDFANARFAFKGECEVARRYRSYWGDEWVATLGFGKGTTGKFSDSEMAANGWVPVVEATEVMQNRQIDAEAHLEQIERLSNQLAVAEEQIKSRRLVIEELMEENARLELILQEPLSLKDMRVAWDAAYEETECHKGDVLVTRHSDDIYEVWVSVETFDISKKTRVLSRAPRPEPWKNLADVLGDFVIYDTDGSNVRAGEAAQFLYEHGVRMAGGDDDE